VTGKTSTHAAARGLESVVSACRGNGAMEYP